MEKVETELRKRYKITCPNCNTVQYATKSIFHLWGLDDGGYGLCLVCRKPMQIIYNKKEDTMSARDWDEYLKEIREKENG